MALSDDEIQQIRDEIGSTEPPTDADLNTSFDRLGDITEVVRSVLKRRLQDLLAAPASVSVSGVYSENNTQNIQELQSKLDALAPSSTVETESRLVRANRSRVPSSTPRAF